MDLHYMWCLYVLISFKNININVTSGYEECNYLNVYMYLEL